MEPPRGSNSSNPYSRRMNADTVDEMARGTQVSRGTNGGVDDPREKPIPFKICFIGNSSVGKTCIVERYVNNTYSVQANTLSAAFSTKVLVAQPKGLDKTKCKLQIWDTAGAEEYRSINQLYYKKAALVCLVYSVTDYESFDALNFWNKELE